MELTEEQQARLELWRRYDVFAPTCLKIHTMEGTLVNFKLNEIQQLLQDIILDIRKEKRLIRLIILKARREGVSTWAAGRFFWKTIMNDNNYAMMITHEPEATDFIFNMQKRFLAHLPEELKPAERYNNRKILEFNDDKGQGLDSAIRVGTAGKEDFGSSQLVHLLHISELSKWDRNIATPLLTSIFQTVPDVPQSEVIIESTAKGIGGEFYSRYWKSRYLYEIYLDEGKPKYKLRINEQADKDNIFNSIFIPWFVFSKYRMVVPEDFKITEEEGKLVDLYGITNEQLQWRRWAIVNRCNDSKEIFMQEYPSCAEEAFITSGIPLFDINKLLMLRKSAPDPINKYEIQIGLRQLIADKKGRFKVWKEPKSERAYVIGADIAEGLEKGDFSCLDVIDHLTGEQVAHWHGKIDPDQFAIIMMIIGKRYNNAILVPERNNHGLIVVNRLMEEGYPKIYTETTVEPPYQPRKRFGWHTTKKNKPAIIDNLVAEIREDVHGIKNKETFSEMITFKQHEDGTLGAESRDDYDDRVMSISIAKYVKTKLPLPSVKRMRAMSKRQWATHMPKKDIPTRGWSR